MTTEKHDAPSPTEVFRGRMLEARKARGMSQQALVGALSQLGHETNQPAIARIERGERGISLDEAFAIAAALDVSPIHMFLPISGDDPVRLAPRLEVSLDRARTWARGRFPLRNENVGFFLDQAPSDAVVDGARLTEDQLRALQEEPLRRLRQVGRVLTEGADGWVDDRWTGGLAKDELEGDEDK